MWCTGWMSGMRRLRVCRLGFSLAVLLVCALAGSAVADAPPTDFPSSIKFTAPTGSGVGVVTLTWQDTPIHVLGGSGYGPVGYEWWSGPSFVANAFGDGTELQVMYYDGTLSWPSWQTSFTGPGGFADLVWDGPASVSNDMGWAPVSSFPLPLPAEAQAAPEPASLLFGLGALPLLLLRRTSRAGSTTRCRGSSV
jgi:hypothetical protein